MVKRYDFTIVTHHHPDFGDMWPRAGSEESRTGDYVLYSDYVALKTRANSLAEGLKRAKRGHYYCDDPWYSCPKDSDGCADESQGEDCNCGTDRFNAEIDTVLAEWETK